MENEYSYILPNANNTIIRNTTKNHSIILIGANGSGKSRLGAWIEKNNPDNVHRIGAQRSLEFEDYINIKSYEQATNLMLYGAERHGNAHDHRWKWDGEKYNYTSSMLNDYEYVLSALLALKNIEQEKYIEECREYEKNGNPHNKVPELVVDKLYRIWNSVYPHRKIKIKDGKVIASMNDREYNGKDMSDGERVVLYLIASALCIPENKTIIIDEPEIHLHRSIMEKLWTAIEKEREDCFFIYITHDTHFASSHKNSIKYWVKEYDGTNWKIECVQESELPEQLLLDILGNRKNVLFVEGTKDSYDTKLYSEIYKDYYVIPCGSCSNVIAQTKAMKANQQLHDLKCYGIIDRDYRSDYEIEAYKKDNIFTLNVAEVENLFIVEELLDVVNSIMGFSDNKRVENIKKYVIQDRFSKEINRQVCNAVVSDIKFKLSTFEISNKKESDAKDSLRKCFNEISYDNIKNEQENKFDSILQNNDYKEILKVYNEKSLSSSVGHFFDLDNKAYKEFVIRQILGNSSEQIINAIRQYLPTEIPI